MTGGLGFSVSGVRRGAVGEGTVGSIVGGVVLPSLESVVEEVDVVDDLALEEPVKLWGLLHG